MWGGGGGGGPSVRVVLRGGGGGGYEQAQFGMAKLGTSKVYQIMQRYLRSEAIFLGVIFRARLVGYFSLHGPSLVPNSLQETTATTQRPTGNNNHHSGLCLFLWLFSAPNSARS